MTQDEIIVWAKEFGLQVKPPSWGYSDTHTIGNIYVEHLEAFAKLVAEAEREACAKVCETFELPEWPDKVRQPLAQAIRARGNT